VLAVAAAALLVYVAERGGDGPIQTYGDALWWAASTITTVGYGDVYPKTAAGRGVAVLLMLIGVSLFGLLTARVAAFFVETEERAEHSKFDEILRRLERLEVQRNSPVQVDAAPSPNTPDYERVGQ
jgi:voltage-gated potassium channel